jgi:hypothetical protein
VPHPTPRSTATRATSVASCPTRRAHSARARSVSTDRARITALGSDQVRCGQAASRQRHTRLSHTSTTGRPPAGRSRTQRGLRSCNVATTPQRGQPVTDSVVSTSSSSSPPYSAAARTTNPGSPRATVAVSTDPPSSRALPFSFTWGLTFVRVFVDYGS